MSKFFWVGNRLAVDFVNTDVMADGVRIELLGCRSDLMAWLREAGVLGRESTHAPRDLMDAARMYRTGLREGMARLAAGRRVPPGLLQGTSLYLGLQTERRDLVCESGAYRLRVQRRFRAVADFLAPVAESFAEMLVRDHPGRLRKCLNPECVLYFYDTSKGGQRSWCSLEQCGNKMRMAAMRQRRAARPKH